MPCESLDGLSGNWDPFKGTRQLPRVDLSGSGRDRYLFNKDFRLISTLSQLN